jgi:hypothetical protein
VERILPTRFQVLAGYVRQPSATLYADELEYFSEGNERVLGILAQDRIDQDFSGIVLGPDKRRRFRCVWTTPFTESKDRARNDLADALAEWNRKPDEDFYQGDERGTPLDVFSPVVPSSELNPSFLLVATHESFIPSRSVIERMMPFFEDVDGNFVREFQTGGFDARIWELYLFAALTEMGFAFDRSFQAPDYLCRSLGPEMFVEAVTANPTVVGGIAAEPFPEDDVGAMKEYFLEYMPIKWGSPLISKLNKRYWELPHVTGKPLILAIQDFHGPMAMSFSFGTLLPYLYGVSFSALYDERGNLVVGTAERSTHTWRGKTIPSGFFRQPGAEHVSAVLSNPVGTISKFNRMGIVAGFGAGCARFGLPEDDISG